MMTYHDLITRNETLRSRLRTLAYILAILMTIPIIYIDPRMIMFAAYHLWLTRVPKEVWQLKRRSDAAATAIVVFAGIVVLLFSIPYFPIVYVGWIIIWQFYKIISRVCTEDCYWCYLKKPKDESLYCPECDHISNAKTDTSLKKHWLKKHNKTDDIFSTICQEHSQIGSIL